MNLTLYFHPLASYCHKVLIALHEHETPFAGHIVDLGNPDASAGFRAMWPIGKMPVLRDEQRGQTVPESTIIIEYLDLHYPGRRPLLPSQEDERLEARLWDRFIDLYVHSPVQKIVADRLRADGERDPRGVADAVSALHTAYDMLEQRVAHRTWLVGQDFSIADCAAAPAMFYAAILVPLPDTHPHLAAYFERLMTRPSVSRVIDEARPWFHLFPFKEAIPTRFLEAHTGTTGTTGTAPRSAGA